MKQTKKGNGIGIVVAAYNAAATLARTLDSVPAAANVDAAADAYAVDVCVVVADDGSTDETAAIMRRRTDGYGCWNCLTVDRRRHVRRLLRPCPNNLIG